MNERNVMFGALNAQQPSPTPKTSSYTQPTRKTSPVALRQATGAFPREAYTQPPQQKENLLQYLYRKIKFGGQRAGGFNQPLSYRKP
jgi:hypothetical protein